MYFMRSVKKNRKITMVKMRKVKTETKTMASLPRTGLVRPKCISQELKHRIVTKHRSGQGSREISAEFKISKNTVAT